MSKEIEIIEKETDKVLEETEIKPVIKPTEYTVTLPDREKQWEKCPALVTKTKTVIHSTTEIIDGVEVKTLSEPLEIEYTEYLTEGEGQETKMVKLSECAIKVDETVTMIDSKTVNGKIGELTAIETKKVINSEAITKTFADIEGVIDENKLKEKASWGLGCPSGCGGFREFTYTEMVPQTYVCPNCGVTINLVKPSDIKS